METLERTWFDKQIQQDIAQHAPWAEGLILQAKRGSLLLVVRARFGAVPADLAARLALLDEASLDRLLERVVQSATLDAAREALGWE